MFSTNNCAYFRNKQRLILSLVTGNYSCDFDVTLCQWTHDTSLPLNWIMYNTSTSSDGTGPQTDASGNNNTIAIIIIIIINTTTSSPFFIIITTTTIIIINNTTASPFSLPSSPPSSLSTSPLPPLPLTSPSSGSPSFLLANYNPSPPQQQLTTKIINHHYSNLESFVAGSGHYLFLNASGKSPGDKAGLISPIIHGNYCMSFKYHMYGATMGTIIVYIKTPNTTRPVWVKSLSQGNHWEDAKVQLSQTTPYRVMLLLQVYNSFKLNAPVSHNLLGPLYNLIKDAFVSK